MANPQSPAVKIKKFCATETMPVSVMEMKEFMAACKDDDRRDGLAEGTTIAELASQIPD
jgi:hypothetical protein